MRQLVAAVLIAALLNACSQATRIITKPEAAKVYIDGKFVGVSPVAWTVRDSEVASKGKPSLPMRVRQLGGDSLV